ncbi:MAG: polymer-forming cytoskeletal protein [Candidatus Omnitrophota bacterium]
MRRKKEVNPLGEEKVLDVNAAMQGTLRFDDPVNLRINGKFEGTLDTKGQLTVGQKADIKANITGESVSVAGNVSGNIRATELLKLDASAIVTGDVDVPRISIQEGAVLNGRIRMTGGGSSSSSSPAQDISSSSRAGWMNIGQVAEYLEVDTSKINEWANTGVLPGTKESGEWVFEKGQIEQWISKGKIKA